MSGGEGLLDIVDIASLVIVRDMITAVHDGDLEALTSTCHRLSRDIHTDEKVYTYISYFLWERARSVLGRPPSVDDAATLAALAQQGPARLEGPGERAFADTIRTVFNYTGANDWAAITLLAINCAYILGNLFDKLPEELDALYPGLADWCGHR